MDKEESDQTALVNHCPDCGQLLDVAGFSPFSKIVCPKCDAAVRVRTTVGRYEISQLLGEGGMSQVFRATDQTLARDVALKILHQDLSKDSGLTAMFEREAKLTASIHHPNVVKVYTVGRDLGYFYIAMELVDAISLEHRIAKHGALGEEEVLNIAHDMASGLQAAYHEDLIHRDIKPGNMLVLEDGTAKLVDFGLAMQQGITDESEDLWATPFYVPPEKLEGESDTFQGDIYSLGATLFHALSGKPPFAANTSSLDELRIIKAAPVSLKDSSENVSKGTINLVEKMMAYVPGDRFDSYDEILRSIESIQKKTFGTTRGRTSGAGGIFSSQWVKVGVGVVVLSIIAALGFYLSNWQGVDDGPLLGNGGDGERVISAAAKIQAERFLKGRKYMTGGDFQKAGEIFDKLAKASELSASTLAWNQFNRGLTRLFNGDEKEARGIFADFVAMEEFSKESPELAGEEMFLRKAAATMNQPLPLLPDAKKAFPADSIQSLGILAGGLKNWDMGQMESAMEWFDLFSASKVPAGFEWISDLKPLVENYRSDLAIITENAPNPSRKTDTTSLEKQRALLETQLGQLKTRGAAPVLLKSRINRIDSIFAREKEAIARAEQQRAREAARAKMADQNVKKPEPVKKPGTQKRPNWTTEESAEIERLSELVTAFSEYDESLLFVEILPKLDAEALETKIGESLKQDLVFTYGQAENFLNTLAERLAVGSYEGTIRFRKKEGLPVEGKIKGPVEAKITGATRYVYIVNLDFGGNEVRVETFSPAWLIEAAEEVFPELSEETVEAWQQLACFAGATGLFEQSRRIGAKVAPLSPEFAARMKRLSILREK